MALVIGNAAYASAPPIPACAASARAVATELRRLDFEIVERVDRSRGESDAAIGHFVKALRPPGSVGVVYVCAYAADFNARTFLLPISANLARDADVMTEGILAKTFLDSVLRGGAGRTGLVVVDAVLRPGAPSPPAFAGLQDLARSGGVGIVLAAGSPAGDAPTVAASVLWAELSGPVVELRALAAGLQQQLAHDPAVTLAAAESPAAPTWLRGGPAALAAAPPAPSPTVPAVPAPAAAPALPAANLPDEAGMSEAQLRDVQAALAQLGYYAGRVDGRFGPESRAAIRRFQFEIGAERTGSLTGPQAMRLLERGR